MLTPDTARRLSADGVCLTPAQVMALLAELDAALERERQASAVLLAWWRAHLDWELRALDTPDRTVVEIQQAYSAARAALYALCEQLEALDHDSH